MRPVIHGFSAAADGRRYTIDRDCILTFVTNACAKCVVSQDSFSTVANCVTSPSNTELKSVLFAGTTPGQYQLSFPLAKDEDIFLSAGAAGTIGLLFDDLIP